MLWRKTVQRNKLCWLCSAQHCRTEQERLSAGKLNFQLIMQRGALLFRVLCESNFEVNFASRWTVNNVAKMLLSWVNKIIVSEMTVVQFIAVAIFLSFFSQICLFLIMKKCSIFYDTTINNRAACRNPMNSRRYGERWRDMEGVEGGGQQPWGIPECSVDSLTLWWLELVVGECSQ